MGSMEDGDKGIVIREIGASWERAKGMRLVLRVDLAVSIIMPIVLFFFYGNLFGYSYWSTILLPSLLFVMAMLALLVLQFVFIRTIGSITVYSNGIQFPRAIIHKLSRRSNFVPRRNIAVVEVVQSSPNQGNVRGDYLIFNVRDDGGRTYWSGPRARNDVTAVGDYFRKEWQVKVEWKGAESKPSAPSTTSYSAPNPPYRSEGARKIPVEPAPNLFCPNCGAQASPSNEFCPMCGHKSGAPVARYAPTYAPPPPPAPPQVQERSPLPTYMQKSPRLAFLLALIPGMFCIMGLGHFYVRKRARGLVLLIVGFFLGLLAWVSLSMVFSESEYDPIIYLITTMIFWAPFIAILLWSAFDASKQATKFNLLPPEGVLRQAPESGGPGYK